MFTKWKNFPYVNMSGKVLAAKKSHGARNTTEASGIQSKNSGSRLVATQPYP